MHGNNGGGDREPRDTCAKRAARYLVPPVVSMGAAIGSGLAYFNYATQAAKIVWNSVPNLPAQAELDTFLARNVTRAPPPLPPLPSIIVMSSFVEILKSEITRGISPLSEILNQYGNDTKAGEVIYARYLNYTEAAKPLWQPSYIPAQPPGLGVPIALGVGVGFVTLGTIVSVLKAWLNSRQRRNSAYQALSQSAQLELGTYGAAQAEQEISTQQLCSHCGQVLTWAHDKAYGEHLACAFCKKHG
jgi:hypothetical protein